MSKVKLVIISVWAVFAVSLIIVGTAAASYEFFVNGARVSEDIEISGIAKTVTIETAIASLPISVQCVEGISPPSAENVIKEKGKSEGKIESKNCYLFENREKKKIFLTACGVREALNINFVGELTNADEDALKGSGTEETFAEIELIGSSCVLKGKYKLKGSETCSIVEAEMDKEIHKSICTPSGSSLKQKGEPGNEAAQLFITESSSLKSGEVWNVETTHSTSPCKKSKAKWVFCSGGNETLAKVLKASNGPMTLGSKIKGLNVEISCTKGTFEPTLEEGGELIGVDKFENCTIPKPEGECTISAKTIMTESIIGKLEGPVPAGPPEIKLESAKFAIIKIEGCEALKGEYTLKGEQKCKVDTKYETEQAEHEMNCEKGGSNLKLEAVAASLSMTAKGPLIGGETWSMQLN
jgi:hypothetical protein